MALLDNIDQVAWTSLVQSDLILGTFTGSVAVPAPTTALFPNKVTGSTTIATGINEKTFFQGVFSVDGGVTWCDFNSNVTLTSGSFVNLQTQMMYGASSVGTLTLYADNWTQTSNGINYSGSAYTFQYKVVLFAKPDQGDVTPQPVTQQRNFSSFYNYQKIYRDYTSNFSYAVGASTGVITHGLGYVPKVRMYVDNFSPASNTSALYDLGYYLSQFVKYQVYLDSTTINFYIDNSAGVAPITGTLYARVYYHDS